MDTANWDWPQWTYVILTILSLLVYATQHGKPREPTNAFIGFLSFGLTYFLLINGGFFE